MTARVSLGLRVVQLVASRVDPFEPLSVGSIASTLDCALSSASRLCAELERIGMLRRAEAYGAYVVGERAIRLSGRAAAPFARAVRFATTRAAQETGETVCVAAPSAEGARIVAVVDSPWTLHAPAEVGELAGEGSALAAVTERWASEATETATGHAFESTSGKCVEVAVPLIAPTGETVAALAVRLPVYRAGRGAPHAGAALARARRTVERELAAHRSRAEGAPTAGASAGAPAALEAAVCMLEHLADGEDTVAAIARSSGLRVDRARRLLQSCCRSGLVSESVDGEYRLAWLVHGWYRAASVPVLVGAGRGEVARTAAEMRTCAFLTVLKGMRSFTLVEELEEIGEGLAMREWLGRPHPIVGSDGGPTLVMDLTAEQLAETFPPRHTPQEFARFLERVELVMRDGVLSIESMEEIGITSVSAPVRDASGLVAAAACIVGATESVKPRIAEIEAAAQDLAARVSALLV